MTEPKIVQKKAIDVVPWIHGIYCTMDGRPEPFVNPIVYRRWNDDGSRIFFGLDTHNTFDAKPEELVDVVETQAMYGSDDLMRDCFEKDRKKMADRPRPPDPNLLTRLSFDNPNVPATPGEWWARIEVRTTQPQPDPRLALQELRSRLLDTVKAVEARLTEPFVVKP